jgi:hypothetical protein
MNLTGFYQKSYCLTTGHCINVIGNDVHMYLKTDKSVNFIGSLAGFQNHYPDLYEKCKELDKGYCAVESTTYAPVSIEIVRKDRVAQLHAIHIPSVTLCVASDQPNTLYLGEGVDALSIAPYRDLSALQSIVNAEVHSA